MEIDYDAQSVYVLFDKAVYQRTYQLNCLYQELLEKVNEFD